MSGAPICQHGLLAVETMHAIVQWLEKYQMKCDVIVCKQETSLFVR